MNPSEIDEGGYEVADMNDPVVRARFEETARQWRSRYCTAIMNCDCTDSCKHLSTPVNTTEVQDGMDIQG
jgi:hypothetical protein